MTERKIICKLLTGSRLYGTNRPDSDEDFTGVFLPGTKDLLGLQNCPTEWTFNEKNSEGDRNTAGDVDCKFYSIQRFFSLAAQGQPAQLEMLMATPENTLITSPEWEYILVNKAIFLSRKGISPFIGFALAQARKAVLKGDNLNLLTRLVAADSYLTDQQKHTALREVGSVIMFKDNPKKGHLLFPLGPNMFHPLPVEENDHGFLLVHVAGWQYDLGTRTKVFLGALETLIARYGTRSKAAAEVGADLKSYLHAYRLISEAKEFLATGHITMPRPDAEFLKSIRDGKYDVDFFAEINTQIDEIRQVIEPVSPLPNLPNYSKIEELCQTILYQQLFGKS